MFRNLSRRKALGAAAAAAAGAAAFPIFNILKSRPSRNIILIICDALRADRIGLKRTYFDAFQSLTPNLDLLATQSLTFTAAKAPSSFTPISLLSLAYSVSPTLVSYDGVNSGKSLPGEPLAARLKSLGYQTLQVTANEVMDFPAARKGFDAFEVLRPFESSKKFREWGQGAVPWGEISGTRVNARTYELLAANRRALEERPLFLQVHFMDTHEPYNYIGFPLKSPEIGKLCPPVFNAAIAAGENEIEGLDFGTAIEYVKEYYDSATCGLDRTCGALFGYLETLGVLDDTLCIVTADHGEEFADNSEIELQRVGHVGPLNEEEIHVPLLVSHTGRGSELTRGKVIKDQVSMCDAVNYFIGSYVADEASYDETKAAIEAERFPAREIVSALNWPKTNVNEVAVVSGGVKLRRFYGGGADRAYRFLAGGGVEEVEMSEDMAALLDNVSSGEGQGAPEIDEESREKLKALGYFN